VNTPETLSTAQRAQIIAEETVHYDAAAGDNVPLDNAQHRNRTRTEVLSIKMYPEEIEAIDAIAERMRVGRSALVRGWMLDRMQDHPLDQPALGVEAIHELAVQLAAELRKVS